MCQFLFMKELICRAEKLLSGGNNLDFLMNVDGRGILRPQWEAKMLKNRERRVCLYTGLIFHWGTAGGWEMKGSLGTCLLKKIFILFKETALSQHKIKQKATEFILRNKGLVSGQSLPWNTTSVKAFTSLIVSVLQNEILAFLELFLNRNSVKSDTMGENKILYQNI